MHVKMIFWKATSSSSNSWIFPFLKFRYVPKQCLHTTQDSAVCSTNKSVTSHDINGIYVTSPFSWRHQGFGYSLHSQT